ncbi:type II toxin-antitoxin system death-on-curing family toxin [Listeria booriae]|uniref:type II toxin-antitoxin system death-on-curing family toxin n=1 Tax=Listeria booriae TaxID=1552123 RepID=UPI0021AB5815|nr:type II toxin-antitoxin system death-on-curing family toxin [Listeria booriae]
MHLSIIPHDTVEAQNEYFYFYKKHIAKKKKMKQSKISIKKISIPLFYQLQIENPAFGFRLLNKTNKKELTLDIMLTRRVCSYHSYEDIMEINEFSQNLFKEEGIYGVKGVKDHNLLCSAVDSIKADYVFGVAAYPTIVDKAAQLWFSLANNHCFSNGNKRTALLATLSFLEMNCYTLNYDFDDLFLYYYTKKIVEKDLTKDQIAKWLKQRLRYDISYLKNNNQIPLLKPYHFRMETTNSK